MSESQMNESTQQIPQTFKVTVPYFEFNDTHMEGSICINKAYTSFESIAGHHTLKIKPLSEEDKSQGWRVKLPRKRKVGENKYGDSKYNTIELTMPLIQLPEHLWDRLGVRFNKSNDYYKMKQLNLDLEIEEQLNPYSYDKKNMQVSDGLYRYIVPKTPYDDDVRELRKLVNQAHPDLDNIRTLVTKLEEGGQSGWLLHKAKRLL